MLDQQLLDAVKSYTAQMTKPVTLVLNTGEHQKKAELEQFLTQLVAVSDLLSLQQRQHPQLTSPISFTLEVDSEPTGVVFSGIPGGHEFSSLILAILQASGSALKLDQQLAHMVAQLSEPLKFEVFVSLGCHNCPDVVQTLNQFALLNDNISTEMIDGALFQQLIDQRGIQGVPSVYLNGELFATGQVDTSQLMEKLLQRYPQISGQAVAEPLSLQDVTVIGGGPAGVAAAIYAARKGLKVTMIADRMGGQVKDTVDIENLISVSKTTGSQLTGNLLQHMSDYQINMRENIRVDRIEKQGRDKVLQLSTGERLPTKTVIVATGAKWRELGVPGEKENIGAGVAYCPHCDGPFFKDKPVAVIGGGNSGIEAALDLSNIASQVTVLEFADSLRADQVLVDKAQQQPNIAIITNAETAHISAEQGKVTGLVYRDRQTDQQQLLALDGVFVQIGLVPNSGFLQNIVECTPQGEIIIDAKSQTSEPGIFAAGDVTTVPYKQIVVAMGEGSKAALSAFDYLIREY